MRHIVIAVAVAALAVCSGAAAGPPKPAGASGRIELKNPEDLSVKAVSDGMPLSLSPDGKRILFIERGKSGVLSYCTVGVDGKGKVRLFDSTIGWDDLLGFCFGHGVWSPDGKRIAALTSHNGKTTQQGGKERMVIVDVARKKHTALPTDLGATWGAVFDAKGGVYYGDMLPSKGRVFRGGLRRYDPKTGKSTSVVRYDDGIVMGLVMSPDRSRIGGFLARARAQGKKGASICLWACDPASGKVATSPPMQFDDYFGGALRAFWDADGSALYSNAADGDKQTPFSIVRFEPFAGAKGKTTLLQRGRCVLAGASYAPGKLSIAADGGKGDGHAFVLDVATDKARPLRLPRLLISRSGNVGLFRYANRRRFCVARIGTR